jgi:hypothetical protein
MNAEHMYDDRKTINIAMYNCVVYKNLKQIWWMQKKRGKKLVSFMSNNQTIDVLGYQSSVITKNPEKPASVKISKIFMTRIGR